MLNEIKDIHASMWISASAGTGKTKSLIDRILALLLNGARPSGILCLTYTKAAASEMSTRLSRYLQKWSLMTDAQLSVELQDLGFDDSHRDIARRLYAESPCTEWVTIQTIHSFCLGLLEKFPLETGLFPNIEICDDYQYEQLLSEAINTVLADDTYRTDWENIAEYECDLNELIKSFGMKIKRFSDKHDNFSELYRTYFNIDFLPQTSDEEDIFLFKKIFDNNHRQLFAELAEGLAKGGVQDNKRAQILSANAQHPTSSFLKAFLKDDGEPFKSLCSKQAAEILPLMEETAQQAQRFADSKKKITAARTNASLFTVMKAIFRKFEELKQRHHCLDYNDIIINALILLENIDWVMYKTDGGLNHVLVDEAQDTSPEQWELIRKITDEFFNNYQSGKTLFVVGDEKQSIYSFQGADVRLFAKMHEYFKNAAAQSGQKFYDVELKKSYRSLGNVLSFVDDVFHDTFKTKHETNRALNQGVVDVIEAFQDDDERSENAVTAEKKIATYIAQYIKHALDSGIAVGDEKRAARPSDFLILFQRRKSEMMYPIIDALKAANIPVSGIDRVHLKDELIVEDLITLAEFAVFPADDLMCARVLKSPIVGMTEEDLMQACLGRQNEHLWDYLLRHEFAQKYHLEKLENYVRLAHSLSVYDFFMHVMTDGVLEKFISRLGAKIVDTLYEFSDIVMQYEKNNTASLASFLAWFRSFDHEMKKEPYGNNNVVRLMTVHASKGLQAPFVIVADAQFMKSAQQTDKILQDEESGMLLWNFKSASQPNNVRNLYEKKKEADAEEADRLLYVALTRAENYLCVLGKANPKKETSPNSWLGKTQNIGAKFETITTFEQNTQRFGQFEIGQHLPIEKERFEVTEMPTWFKEKLPTPIAENADDEIDTPQITYGNYVHLLLSELPKYPRKMAHDVAIELADKFDLSNENIHQAMFEVERIFEKHEFLFGENSSAEVPFVFKGQEKRIDRLVETDSQIWIIDFKTGTPHSTIPQAYVNQLNEYKRAVAAIKNIADFQIKTAILWTKNAELAVVSA